MNVPSGYSALDLVGFTDKGDYSASTNYVKNDLVHYDDKIWKCLIDDTTAIEPTEGVNWTLWIQQSNSLDGLADVEITNAQDGQEITYDGTTQKWKNTSKIQTLTNQVRDMNNVYGSKNLLPNDVTSQTVSGVTYTKNADGTITINGTRTTAGGITISEFSLEAGKKYKYSIGNPFNLSNTAGSNIQGFDGTAWVALGNIFGTETEAEFESNSSYSKYRVNINSNNGVTFSNLTIKPMIRLASITDDTYEPYAKSNRELTEELKNRLPLLIDSGMINANSSKAISITDSSSALYRLTLGSIGGDNIGKIVIFGKHPSVANIKYSTFDCDNISVDYAATISVSGNTLTITTPTNSNCMYTLEQIRA